MKLQLSKAQMWIAAAILVILLAAGGYKVMHKTGESGIAPNSGGTGTNAADSVPGANQAADSKYPGITTVTSKQEFISKHENWINRLDEIAQKVNVAYGGWSSGKIKTDEFLNTCGTLRQEIKILNKETDLYTEYNLNRADQQSVNYTAVIKGYAHASKDVNDFLEYAFRSSDEKIKDRYANLMETKYKNDLAQLKKDMKS
ncbi:hypothetical protein Dtox_3317 [Desulfofarcimen acetoxidans DSM 771]|jgi:hypothetical protein|uniref:Uncharacterized protein n=1 Tax=Desulfofarcimen acetoxidans (strain ATCC 49208 / DSM 771 / KCTC 5769 / VKM B-1644 / 5575) TaxID=485916 RepID=C8W5P8_DESAS|nr:hypothetical protein [Desulfofarcimen acetoxidans]ACV64048.1 hypothetical protein Dtox_3317 [Desulfofarcimen acetoxidans DSM 771]